MRRDFGLIGYPLEHSFSKGLFERKFAEEKIENVSYENFPTETIDLLPVLLSKNENLYGFNVTIPYKEAILPYLDRISDEAKEIGAVNVVKIDRSSGGIKLWGYNTDTLGFEKSLLEHKESKHSSALILGTGGAAKSAGYVLKKLNIKYLHVSRQPKPNALTYEMLDKNTIKDHLLIINTTPLGMFPQVDTCPPIDYAAIGKDHFLFDMVYNPAQTLFMKKGKENGAKVQNGYDMLRYQAEKTWEIFNN